MNTIYLDFHDTGVIVDILKKYSDEYCLFLANKNNIDKKKKITISDNLKRVESVPGLKILFDNKKEYSSCVIGTCLVAKSLDEVGEILSFYKKYDYETLDRR